MNTQQLKACERTHAELESSHYAALSNPHYRMEYLLDTLQCENSSSNAMVYGIDRAKEKPSPRAHIEDMGYEQLQNEVRGWREKHAEMMLELDKINKKLGRTKQQYINYEPEVKTVKGVKSVNA